MATICNTAPIPHNGSANGANAPKATVATKAKDTETAAKNEDFTGCCHSSTTC